MPPNIVCSGFVRFAAAAATPRRSRMWYVSNAWLSDRFARVLARASCLCYFKGVVHFGPTRYFHYKRRRPQRNGQRRNSAIVGGGAGRHERRTSCNCRYLAAAGDRRNSVNAPQRRCAPGGCGTTVLVAYRLATGGRRCVSPRSGEKRVTARGSISGFSAQKQQGPLAALRSPGKSFSVIIHVLNRNTQLATPFIWFCLVWIFYYRPL
ncbi:hypothetical protein LMG30113_07556 [Burkholderia paludis]|nr:hypothetical protein LMG30113_07556 [Burkholderia paludis]